MEQNVYKDLYEAQQQNKMLAETLNFIVGSLSQATSIDIKEVGGIEQFIEKVIELVKTSEPVEGEVVLDN